MIGSGWRRRGGVRGYRWLEVVSLIAILVVAGLGIARVLFGG
jgi:heme A synthase